MKVLLVADEFFSWGVYGGFGAFTRKLAKELVKRGVEVEVIVHKISDSQKPVGETEWIDDIPVKTLPRGKIAKFRRDDLYKTDVDVIHSECGKLDTFLAFTCNWQPKIVTVQDLRTERDMEVIGVTEKKNLFKRTWNRIVNHYYKHALKMADVVACQADLLEPKIRENFQLTREIRTLPNFVDLPKGKICKSDSPSVVWLGRLDRIKRPELCFEVAKANPDVQFTILGEAHDKTRDVQLRRHYSPVKNLLFRGFTTGKEKDEWLRDAWILINTSVYEALPVSFLEALSHKCALLSTRNPDGYTSKFGFYASKSAFSAGTTIKWLTSGLNWLIRNDWWRNLGEDGYRYVKKVHSTKKGVEAHIQLYRELIE